MGISSLPSPSEGVLSIIVINTILSITALTSILRSILTLVRIHLPPSSSSQLEAVVSPSHHLRHLPIPPTIPFESIDHHNDCDCSVCLARFEPESEVSRLPCGHFFHTRCFERWLECWKVTCPLCRTPLLRQDDDEDSPSSCPWS